MQEGGRQCVENKERLTLRIHRGRSTSQRPMMTSVLMAKHGCHPPGLGPALAGIGTKDMVTHLTEVSTTTATTGPPASGTAAVSGSAGQPPVGGGAAGRFVLDCDLCNSGKEEPIKQQQQQHQQQNRYRRQQPTPDDDDDDETSGLRENVSNASQAYKVLYMETPLCGCTHRGGGVGGLAGGGGSTGGGGGGGGGIGTGGGSNKRSSTLEIFQTGPNSSTRSRIGRRNKSRKKGGGAHQRFLANNGKDSGSAGAMEDGRGGDATGAGGNNKPVLKLNRRNIKAQVKRFKMETKAAKTLGKSISSSSASYASSKFRFTY